MHRPPTSEEVESFVKDAHNFFHAIRTRDFRSKEFQEMLKFALIFAAFGASVTALAAIGQLIAIGVHAAVRIYWGWWIVGATAMPGILLVSLGIFAGFDSLGRRFDALATRSLTPAFRQGISRWSANLLILGLLGAMIAMFGWVGYSTAREQNPLLISQPEIKKVSLSVAQQISGLESLSRGATALLTQLDETEKQISSARIELSSSLKNYEDQQQAARKTADELKQLEDRRIQIDLQMAEVKNILNGNVPMTREDLQRSNKWSLLTGILVGFLTSFAASYAYAYLARRIRRHSAES